MRGIVSGAMLCAVQELGLAPCIDALYGFSAGAINSAYFLMGTPWYHLSVYYKNLASRQFIDFSRLLRGRSPVDLLYAFNQITVGNMKIDYNKIFNASHTLHVGVTNVDETLTEVVTSFVSQADFIETLFASSWMPISSFRPTTWRGVRALDGGVLTGHPVQLAIDDNCTHVLSLSTRSIRPPSYRGPKVARLIGAAHLNRMEPGLGASYLQAADHYWLQRSEMHRARLGFGDQPYILDIAPLPATPDLTYYESSRDQLLRAAKRAYALAYSVLDNVPPYKCNDPGMPRLRIVEDRTRTAETLRSINQGAGPYDHS